MELDAYFMFNGIYPVIYLYLVNEFEVLPLFLTLFLASNLIEVLKLNW